MIKFGDKVFIKKTSRFYYQAPGIRGEVLNSEEILGEGWIWVKFVNGYQNEYQLGDLRLAQTEEEMLSVKTKILSKMKAITTDRRLENGN